MIRVIGRGVHDVGEDSDFMIALCLRILELRLFLDIPNVPLQPFEIDFCLSILPNDLSV